MVRSARELMTGFAVYLTYNAAYDAPNLAGNKSKSSRHRRSRTLNDMKPTKPLQPGANTRHPKKK